MCNIKHFTYLEQNMCSFSYQEDTDQQNEVAEETMYFPLKRLTLSVASVSSLNFVVTDINIFCSELYE